MKLAEFRDNCFRTWKQDETEYDLIVNLLHANIGITSETNELETALITKDKVNISEELADKLYYLCVYLTYRGIPLDYYEKILNQYRSHLSINPEASLSNMYRTSSLLSDIVKKMCFYLKEPDYKKEEDLLKLYFYYIAEVFCYFHLDWDTATTKLIAKLRVRFPDKFTFDNANNRDLESEYSALS